MKRIYHDYRLWECYLNGMYVERKGAERLPYTNLAVELLRDEKRLYSHMVAVTQEWMFSCQNHMTCRNANRQAYLGQAACNHAHGVGESETRDAWSQLSSDEKLIANTVADEIILMWEGVHEEYEKKIRDERIRSSKGKNCLDV